MYSISVAVRSWTLCLLFTLASGHLFGAEPSAKPSEKLPAARDLVEKYIRACGGKEAFGKHKSQFGKGKFEMPGQGIVGEVEIYAARPNKILMKQTIPGLGVMISGYDGTVGFASSPATGPMLVEGKSLEDVKEQADYDAALHDPSKFKSLETVERTTFEGQDAYKVKVIKKNDDEAFDYYDVKTGLLLGTVGPQETPLGKVHVTSTVADYKKYGGILLATKLVQKMAGVEQVVTLQTVEFDNVPESVFELPADVKALTKPKP